MRGWMRFWLLAGLGCCAAAWAQGTPYPERPIRFILPFPPGSGTDTSARFVGQHITDATRQPVVIDNRAGADGIIAAQAVATAAPDGYTVFVTTMTTQSVNPHIYRKLPYDPVRDFESITLFTRSPMIMVVRNQPDQPKSVAEFIAHARGRAGQLNFGTGNTSSRIGAEFFSRKNGLAVTRVPYRGTPQVLADILAGRLDFMFVDLSPAVPLVKAGRLRALTVTGPARLPALPEVPTTTELGMPDLQLFTWSGAFVPAATPRPVVERLSDLMQKALRSKEAADFYAKNSIEPRPMTLAEMSAFIKSEYEVWGRAVKFAGIEPE